MSDCNKHKWIYPIQPVTEPEHRYCKFCGNINIKEDGGWDDEED